MDEKNPGIKIGPPRVRGIIFEGTLEFGVDPDILRWLGGKGYLYDSENGTYWRIIAYDEKSGQVNLTEIIWHAKPWLEGSA